MTSLSSRKLRLSYTLEDVNYAFQESFLVKEVGKIIPFPKLTMIKKTLIAPNTVVNTFSINDDYCQ